ncbi:hypothetical protein J23TS9_26260 [Paenibacillus sp. J23TS9]|uniref:hypothetical protein n=1 Tax=Paenibacillus sp. J23TS9 TaxID=2807193 RepID=UPI001B1F5CF5|nr:hypothetical protein [Paenibacillus sp. J23TS9]GIP27496.1 hypothetical protein J23TS9_26260 [Paenibacillus sp. J23TS9]
MMKKVRKIHYWIGIIATVFLLIESATGMIMYFEEGGKRSGIERSGGMNTFRNFNGSGGIEQGTSNATSPSAGTDSGTSSGQAKGSMGTSYQGGFAASGRSGEFQRPGDSGSLGISVRSLHQGVIGLISGLAMFILTGTGVAMSLMIWRSNRKKKNRGLVSKTAAPPGNIL